MGRHLTFALGLTVVVSLARTATGCSSSSNLTGNPDASEDDGACAAAGGSCITGGALRCPAVGPQSCGAEGVCCVVNTNVGDAGADTGTDACAPSGCTGSCLSGRHNLSSIVDGCLVWQCCVPDDAGADASGE
jgi:hypothetical protein